jgi:hypothetical protein
MAGSQPECGNQQQHPPPGRQCGQLLHEEHPGKKCQRGESDIVLLTFGSDRFRLPPNIPY